MKKLILVLVIITLLISCKKEEKTEPKSDKTETIKIVQDTLATSSNYDILGSWFPQSMGNSDFDSLEICKTILHLYYSQGEIALNYKVVANEMILTYDYAEVKLNKDGDDCNGKKVGKFYKDNLGNLILDINTNGLNCFGINSGKFVFQRGVSPAIDAIEEVETEKGTVIYFDTFKVMIPGFESKTDTNVNKKEPNTEYITDNSDGWGMSDKKLKIKANSQDWKFDIEYCFVESLSIQTDGSIVWKGNSNYRKLTKIDNHNFVLPEFSHVFYNQCQKELQQKLKLKDTIVEYEYSIANLLYQDKPVLFNPITLILKIKNDSEVQNFIKIEIYEGGD